MRRSSTIRVLHTPRTRMSTTRHSSATSPFEWPGWGIIPAITRIPFITARGAATRGAGDGAWALASVTDSAAEVGAWASAVGGATADWATVVMVPTARTATGDDRSGGAS